MPADLPAVDVIIVNYCTASLVIACLESLEPELRNVPRMRVIVVDNKSPDGSAATIAAAIEARDWTWVTLLRAPRNDGYGAGNNLGLDWALSDPAPADFFWLLNPDTQVMPSAGAQLTRFMLKHPQAGAAGSALLEGDGRPWPFAFRFPSILGEIERGARWGPLSRLLRHRATLRRMGDVPEQVDWISGASMMLRREALEMGVRFDEAFFLYYEETDLCLQARRMGWECWYVPSAVVLHIAGQSTGVTGARSHSRPLPPYWYRSRQRYFLKNHGFVYGLLADIGWIGAHLFARTKRVFRPGPDPDPPKLLSDFLRYSTLAWLVGARTRGSAAIG